MASSSQTSNWTAGQAYGMAIVCLVTGVVIGFLVHGPATTLTSAALQPPGAPPSRPAGPASIAPPLSTPQPSPAQMKAASSQAATPILERLKSDPKNFKLLVEAGEMYYHHAAYAEAGDYYRRALAIQENVPVRNQYASALFYEGDANGSLQQYARVLEADPTNDVALFNSGMVKFKAKNDAKGAVELWEKLLQAYPNHPQRSRVQNMIEHASRPQS